MLTYKPNWDRQSTSTGYKVVHCLDHPRAWSTGYVYVHTVLVEQTLDRLLESWEMVHHVDGDRMNNSPENLEVKTRSRHTADHNRERSVGPIKLVCALCKKTFFRRKGQDPSAKRYMRAFCSRSHSGSYYAKKRVAVDIA